MNKEKRDFKLRRNTRELSPDILARILRKMTVEKDASEIYENLTDQKIPERKEKH